MSLNVALSSAVSSLLLLEKQMGVTANNIANANTTGYSEETVQVGTAVSGGTGTGVTDLGTTSSVDQFLLASVISQTGTSAQASAYNTLYQSLQTALGSISTNTTGGNDLTSQLSSLESDLTTLATTPSDTSLDTNVVNDLYNLASNLNSTSTQIQNLRSTADQDISNAVNDANTQLNTINSLNKKIAQAEAQGQPTAAYEDQRNNALSALTGDLGVTSYVDGNDQMQIYTTSGQPLLVGGTVVPLSHQAVSMSGSTSYANGSVNGIMVGNTDITSDITSGSIAGYLQMRDTELPNAQNSLDTLAQNLSATLNSIANQGTANPPPSTLTSATGISFGGTDQLTVAAGTTIRVAMVDSSGQVQSYQDISLAGATDVNDVISDINGAFGNPTPPVAQLNSVGQLTLTSTTAGQGIAVSTTSGSLETTGSSTSTDFSSLFHLNDVVTGGSSAATISVNPALLKNANLLPSATLNTSATTVPYAGVGASDGVNATALANALQTNQTFSSSTATGTATKSSVTATLVPAVSGSFTIVGGSKPVSVTLTTPASLQSIMQDINNAATAAGVTGVQASVIGNGTYQLQVTSGGTSLAFTNVSGNVLSSLGLSSAPSGYLGAASTTLSGYASNIIADIASRASTASATETTQTTTLNTLQNNLSSQSGVNTDQETANLTALQSAYAASAKVVSTVQAMFTALLQAVQS